MAECTVQRSTRHGQARRGHRSSVHKIWSGIVKRTNDSNSHAWKWYGGRGIKLCEEWRDFQRFYEHVGDRPDGMSIDRIDNNGNYEPGNVRWATMSEQANNRSNNVIITWLGVGYTITQLAAKLGIKKSRIVGWIYHHRDIDKLIRKAVQCG